ncbi:MAG: HAD family hydrolase [Hyphomicrobiales bacterium]
MSAPLLVFDLDGTLLETAPDLVGSLNSVLEKEGLKSIPIQTARTYIGQGARMMIELGFKANQLSISHEEIEALVPGFLEIYEARISLKTHAFPNLLEVLDELSEGGWQFAVCTNKMERLARILLEDLNLTDRFVAITGGDTFENKKPHPDHILKTIALTDSLPERSIMVGDSASDINAAKAADVPVIAVDFGYTPVHVSELNPDIVISSFNELHSAIEVVRPGLLSN